MDQKRTPNFTIKEKHLLVDIVAKYKETVENKGTSTIINNKKTEAWKKIVAEFNSEVEVARTLKYLRLLYANLKRKTRKDVAEEHKDQYLKARITDEEDRQQINKTGGGIYKPQLDDMGAQILASVGDQMQPLTNEFDDAANYFADEVDRVTEPVIQHEPELTLDYEAESAFELQQGPNLQPHSSSRKQVKRKKPDYKKLYFKKNMK